MGPPIPAKFMSTKTIISIDHDTIVSALFETSVDNPTALLPQTPSLHDFLLHYIPPLSSTVPPLDIAPVPVVLPACKYCQGNFDTHLLILLVLLIY